MVVARAFGAVGAVGAAGATGYTDDRWVGGWVWSCRSSCPSISLVELFSVALALAFALVVAAETACARGRPRCDVPLSQSAIVMCVKTPVFLHRYVLRVAKSL